MIGGSIREKMGKKVWYFTPTMPSRIYHFLSEVDKITSEFDYKKYDLLVFLDFSDISRIQGFYDKNPAYFDNQEIVVIDHHVYTDEHKNRNVITDPKAMSACEVILNTLINGGQNYMTKKLQLVFYLGLTTDSWNFRYDEDHKKRVLTNALHLVELGGR